MKSCGEVFIACQATDDNMAHALCVLDTRAAHTNSDYLIFIAFPLQQRLLVRAQVLHFTHIACLDFQNKIFH